MILRWSTGKRSQQLQKRPHLHRHLSHRPQAGQGDHHDDHDGVDEDAENNHHAQLFNWFPVDGSDSVCLLGRLGSVQRTLHLGDGRPAQGVDQP